MLVSDLAMPGADRDLLSNPRTPNKPNKLQFLSDADYQANQKSFKNLNLLGIQQ
jgi:hypothetical protein